MESDPTHVLVAAPKETGATERRILFAVTGLSPQVITETLYALAVGRRQPWVPDEIHVLTTEEGARRLKLMLLSEEPGWFHRMCRDYHLPAIRFDDSTIRVVTGPTGAPLADIRNAADNEAVADCIAKSIRELTDSPDTSLHVSLAGGRKTMGFYAGYGLSLYGRAQDRLSHVLVSAPFETHPEFFYPTPYSRTIYTSAPEYRPLDTREATVTLAEISFVRLRYGLSAAHPGGAASYSESVDALNRSLAPPRLKIDLSARCIEAGSRRFTLPAAELALLSLFARRALQGAPPIAAPPKNSPDPAWADAYLAERRLIGGPLADLESAERALRSGMDGDYFSPLKSKLHRLLRQNLQHAAEPYLIGDGSGRPRRYALTLPPEGISFAPYSV